MGGDFGLASNLVNMGTSHELGINLGYENYERSKTIVIRDVVI